MTSGVHARAIVADAELAQDVVVGPLAVVGDGCRLAPATVVGAHATLGDDVRLAAGVEIAGGARLGDGVRVDEGARVGENAVVAAGVTVGRRALVDPGAYVVSDVPATAVVRGNPAVIVGYVDASVTPAAIASAHVGDDPVEVGAGCRLLPLPRFGDLRGALVAVEYERDLPFVPARSFLVFGVPSEEVRGEHAHRWCSQVLVAAHGALSVVVDDGDESVEVRLDRPDVGLLVPDRVWGVQYRFSSDAVLCVFASHPYDPDDYIRDYEEFLAFASAQDSTTSSG